MVRAASHSARRLSSSSCGKRFAPDGGLNRTARLLLLKAIAAGTGRASARSIDRIRASAALKVAQFVVKRARDGNRVGVGAQATWGGNHPDSTPRLLTCCSSVLVNHSNTLRPSACRQIEDDAGTYLLQGAVVFDGKAVQDVPLTFGDRSCGTLRECVQRFSII
jgi:hypothetical protein